MNLTSKRMLQFFAGCAGALALSATAQNTYVADNFEYVGAGQGPTNGVVNMPISTYKCQPWGDEGIWQFTNYVWYTESSDDLSKLVEETQNYTGIRPIAGSTTNLVLNLETNGKTLVRTNSAALDFLTTPVYVDTLIKFTPSEDNPTLESMDASVKAAVFVNVSSNLVVYHKDGSLAKTMTDTGVFIDPAQWYRLTILLSDVESTPVFQVFLNGNPVTTGSYVDGWYISASDELVFNAVAFQGTGMVDELVVTENTPDFGAPSATWLTMSFDSAQVSVLTNGIAIANNDSVKDSSAVSIIAKPWFRITDGGALLVNATTNEFTAGVITGLVGTVTGSNGQTNTVASAAYSATTGLPAGYTDTSISDLSAWATANNVTPEGLTEAMLDDYLLNVAPGTDAELKITKITYGPSEVTVEIQATVGGLDLSAGTINGYLNIWTTDNLVSTPFVRIDTAVITIDAGATQTVTVPVADGKFIRAKVETSPAALP